MSDAMRKALRRPRRIKIGATVDLLLLQAVDSFVGQHPELDRSAVIDEALRLWYARQQEQAMEEQFSAPTEATEDEERAAWRRIQAAAAERVFQPRQT